MSTISAFNKEHQMFEQFWYTLNSANNSITYSICNSEVVVWVNDNDDFNKLRGKHILEDLTVKCKLTKIVWQLPWKVSSYNAAPLEKFKKMTEYTSEFPEHNYDFYFNES